MKKAHPPDLRERRVPEAGRENWWTNTGSGKRAWSRNLRPGPKKRDSPWCRSRSALSPVRMSSRWWPANPMPLDQLENLVDQGQFPKRLLNNLKVKYGQLSARDGAGSQRDPESGEDHPGRADRPGQIRHLPPGRGAIGDLREKYPQPKIHAYLDEVKDSHSGEPQPLPAQGRDPAASHSRAGHAHSRGYLQRIPGERSGG